MFNIHLTCFLTLLVLWLLPNAVPRSFDTHEEKGKIRVAIIITIVGRNKLSEYFEWSCKSVEYSKELFDMLIFHEENAELTKKMENEVCASNVKYINLGVNGFSREIVSLIMKNDKSLKVSH